jgi:predicted O-methyltransferase YrrM
MPELSLAKLGRAVTDPHYLAGAVMRRMADNVDRHWFPYLERIGIHARKVHYYSPIPDTRSLPDSLWAAKSTLPGVDMRLATQEALARELAQFRDEFLRFPIEATADERQFYLLNNMYGSVDAEVLYGIVRSRKPRRLIEIGSGFSTLLMSEALQRNAEEGHQGEIMSVEPYPREFLHGLPHLTRLIQRPVQVVPLAEFEALEAGDILFIDSSHVSKVGSDVCYEFLEILPRLEPGVLVHVHDIFLPEEYPRSWIMDLHYFWNEQYLLQAFLAFNKGFRVLWAGRYMHVNTPALLDETFPSYRQFASDTFPSSFWMERTDS